MSLRILLADDHVIVRQGVKNLLTEAGYQVVGEATDGREAVQLSRDLRPDIALLDLAMPLLNGIDAAREILKVSRGTKPILLTMQKEGPYVAESFRAGMKGYVLKTQGVQDLVEAIRTVAPRFSARRMVKEYTERMYAPALERRTSLKSEV